MARLGRPLKEAKAGTRAPLALRVTAKTKSRLIAAAKKSGRSLSQETEVLLERSLRDDEIVERLGDLRHLLVALIRQQEPSWATDLRDGPVADILAAADVADYIRPKRAEK